MNDVIHSLLVEFRVFTFICQICDFRDNAFIVQEEFSGAADTLRFLQSICIWDREWRSGVVACLAFVMRHF